MTNQNTREQSVLNRLSTMGSEWGMTQGGKVTPHPTPPPTLAGQDSY